MLTDKKMMSLKDKYYGDKPAPKKEKKSVVKPKEVKVVEKSKKSKKK